MGPTTVAIVPHTHWDREWYAPFQEYRLRLVRLVDGLLTLLEQDPSYARFLLDGQTVLLDDYLEIRPEAGPRLQRLAASGRLQVGPWAVLMDEFMVSGETIVRDLQLGIARATELGGAMPVGYLPDMFGHVAQMPQLLRLAGVEHAVVWRGVPSAVTTTAFWWEAPDGSRVRAEYLYGSYANGRDLPDDATALVARAHGYERELGPARLDGGDLLLMNGTDHRGPQPGLGRVVREANELQDEYRFVITSLPEHLAAQPTEWLPTWRGELRSGARADVLMGVASNRVDVHRAAAAAERALERRAEPLSALLLPPERYPTRLLDLAWRNLVLNSAHDSSCACSADDVVDAVVVRYQEARHIGDALTREALRTFATEIDAPPASTVVVNPVAAARRGLVRAVVPGDEPVHFVAEDGTPCPTQIVRPLRGEGLSTIVVGQKVRWLLELMRGPELASIRTARVEEQRHDDGTYEMVFHAARPGEGAIDLEPSRERLLELGEEGATVRIRQVLAPAQEVAFVAEAVPGFGWRTFTVHHGAGPGSDVRVGHGELANEHLSVVVDPDDGTFSVRTADGVELDGCHRLVDGGDGGDTYSYSPPTRDLVVDAPDFVRVHTLETGPAFGRMLVESLYHWPQHALGDERRCWERSEETVLAEVRTFLELRAGERFLRVRVELDNRARDHRLRAHIPLPAPVAGSHAECAFAVVERGLTAEGGPHEEGLPTFVSRRFVDCSDGEVGVALLHDGLLEYEVVEDGSELALTLLRATGYLSRAEPALRPNPAGPLDPLEGPQMQGRQVAEYAVLPHRGGVHDADLHAAADDFLVPLERVRGGGWPGAARASSGSLLRVEGAPVSAVRREAGALVVRVHNPAAEEATMRITRPDGPAAGWVVDLRGRPLEPFAGEVALPAGRIATLQLADTP